MSDEWTKEANAAFIAAQGEIPFVPEGGRNQFHKYNYARTEDYIQTIRPILANHGFGLSFSCVDVVSIDPIKTKNGSQELGTRVTMEGRLMYQDGSILTARGFGDGYDAADKGVYKAQTGARKYLMAAMFNLATGDEPEDDQRQPTQQTSQPSQQRRQAPAAPPVTDPDALPPFPKEHITDDDRAKIDNGEHHLNQLVELLQSVKNDKREPKAILQEFSALRDINDGGKPIPGTGYDFISMFWAYKGTDQEKFELNMKRFTATMNRINEAINELQKDDLPY